MSQKFEDMNEVITEFNSNRTTVKSKTQSNTSGKDYTYVKPQCLAAIGWVGLEFDYIDQIKNLIEEVTEDYNKRVIYYLESALSRLSQLKFCSLPIRGELEECIASIHDQNKSLKEYVSQLEDYVKLVNETEDSIVEQFSTIGCDYVIPGKDSTYTSDVGPINIGGDSLFDKFKDGLSELGEDIVHGTKVVDAAVSSLAEKLEEISDEFICGASVALDNNIFFGVCQDIVQVENEPDTPYYNAGKVAGDITSIIIGAEEIAAGTAGEVGGLALDATGVGVVVGAPINVASTALIAHGITAVGAGVYNLEKDKPDTFKDFSEIGNVVGTKGGSEAKISKKAEEHIVENHGSNSTVPNKSKFNDDFNIMKGINNALTNANSTSTPTTNGRTIIEYSYKNPIGTNSNGKLINTIRVIVDTLGRVITAYPVK